VDSARNPQRANRPDFSNVFRSVLLLVRYPLPVLAQNSHASVKLLSAEVAALRRLLAWVWYRGYWVGKFYLGCNPVKQLKSCYKVIQVISFDYDLAWIVDSKTRSMMSAIGNIFWALAPRRMCR